MRVRAVVSGQVQGVGYRAWTQRTAAGLGLRGWARNLPDGTVEIVAEGEAEAVDALLAACRRGPPPARPERVEAAEAPDAPLAPPEGGFGF